MKPKIRMIYILKSVTDNTEISRSKSLRGLIRHVHKHGVKKVFVFSNPDGSGEISVLYKNGNICRAPFADFNVACSFVERRAKRWAVEILTNAKEYKRYGSV